VRLASAAPPDILRGIILMCLGVSVFPLMNAAVKLLTAHYPVMQIVWAPFRAVRPLSSRRSAMSS
jgi:hypothetical protein